MSDFSELSLESLVIEWAEAIKEWTIGNNTFRDGFDVNRYSLAKAALLERAARLKAARELIL